MSNRGDELIEQLCSGADGETAAALLHEMFTGYPIENLRTLLHCSNVDGLKAGAWIASELGIQAAPIMDEVRALLHNNHAYVRFFTIDTVLINGTDEFGDEIADAIKLIDDPEQSVRWKALHFLAQATDEQLAVGVAHLDDGDLAEGVAGLLDSSKRPVSEIIESLASDDQHSRTFAAAAAARVFDRAPGPLSWPPNRTILR